MTNPDSSLALARSKLKIEGKVETLAVPEIVIPGFGKMPAATESNDDASQHKVKYTVAANDSTLLHEFCHVKLNEIGFKKAELLAFSSGQATPEVKKAIILVSEVYADGLLFSHFKESRAVMQALDDRFLFAKAIQKIVRELHSEGIVGAVSHRVSKKLSGYDLDEAFKFAFEEAFKGKERAIYNEVYTVMSRLPIINECVDGPKDFTASDIASIEARILELSKVIVKRKL